MATYKVIQDIEAEDKLIGPLSLRQFIYAVIVVVSGFAVFKLFFVQPLLTLPFLPIMLLFGVLAAPFGHDQSSEIWLLAKIRFALKPRRRIWDQSGLQELVKVTAPKRVEQNLTNGLSEGQVKSRLQALAQTIDTRGWAVKGVSTNLYAAPALGGQGGNDDRLLSPTFTNPVDDTTTDEDILDLQNNPLSQHMGQMVAASDQTRRQALLNKMDKLRKTASNQPEPAAQAAPQPQLPPQPKQSPYGQTAVMQPDIPDVSAAASTAPTAAAKAAAAAALDQKTPAMTAPAKPAILKLAKNDDLSVAALSRQADKGQDDNEVVVSLR